MTRSSFAMLVAALIFVPTSVFAQEQGEVAFDDDVQHAFSLTLSPIHLALPIGELTGEYRLADKMGVALILGVGQITSEITTLAGTKEESFTAFEGGAQFRYYLLGSFIHGMQLGAEVAYLYVDRDANDSLSASGEGLAIGPFVGYKIATNIGFTFEAQAGFQYLAVQAKASNAGTSVSKDTDDIIPLINLNVGWSF